MKAALNANGVAYPTCAATGPILPPGGVIALTSGASVAFALAAVS